MAFAKSPSARSGTLGFIALIAVSAIGTITASEASAAAKCTGLKARCAVAVGGRCDPVTGRWAVHKEGAGGKVQMFIACLDRERQAKVR